MRSVWMPLLLPWGAKCGRANPVFLSAWGQPLKPNPPKQPQTPTRRRASRQSVN